MSGRVETVSAAGGRATLSIPAGALPDGVTDDSITITEEDVAETDIRVDDVPPDAVFKLEPGGLVFAQPVTLTLRIPIEGLLREYPLPLLLLVSEEGAELVDDAAFVYDLEANELVVEAVISHFSRAVLTTDKAISVEIEDLRGK